MREMTGEDAALARIIIEHKGAQNAIHGAALIHEWRREMGVLPDQPTARPRTWERALRKSVNRLIFDHGMPIIGDHSRGNYLVGWLPESETTRETLKKHALHELYKAARLKKLSPAELIGQLTFDFLDELGADMPG